MPESALTCSLQQMSQPRARASQLSMINNHHWAPTSEEVLETAARDYIENLPRDRWRLMRSCKERNNYHQVLKAEKLPGAMWYSVENQGNAIDQFNINMKSLDQAKE